MPFQHARDTEAEHEQDISNQRPGPAVMIVDSRPSPPLNGGGIQRTHTRASSRVAIKFRETGEEYAPPELELKTGFDIEVVYQVVADRRLAFDNMTWQVPTMGLTAHAFLFSIGLAPNATTASRIISMALSLVFTFLTARLFIGHMEREVADRTWLAAFEKAYLPKICHVHTKGWQFRKIADRRKASWMRPLFVFPAFAVWRDGLMCLGAGAIIVIVLSVLRPDWLDVPNA
ncbi:hypothetical protein EXIGLDRAFT_832349 [Exidia glandulosa HHB12029]|uniref:Uncharacterized protein n=1 Tax=Exidia glandulosa HHB12029 TaxID=1314781 RepID=A0A165LSK1_EXIGL|nr:hypothetical protein EXIGLDRAFT_832349 [Exidia glandulosa HHB12029]